MPNLFYYVAKGKTITPPTLVIEISASNLHTIATTNKNVTWGWGNNGNGQLGDNTTTQRNSPVSVLGATKTFCKISAGGSHTMAIDKNGRAWGWGANNFGQLGINSTASQLTPVSVLGAVKTFCQISAGLNHTMAIDKNGRAWGWGNNGNGQLGDNSVTSRRTPVSVLGTVKTFCQIRAGSSHTMAIDKNGRAWGWGDNSNGKIGDNSITSRRTPVSVLGAVKTFCQINAGVNYTMAIDKNGRAWGWGNNQQGQLGDNTQTSQTTPVSVLGGVKTFCKISTGVQHTAAIDKNGRVWCWGQNNQGEIGNNTIAFRCLTPVSVAGAGAVKTFCEIKAGNSYTMAIDNNGKVWGWGANYNGQLGIGITTITPLSVVGAVKTFCQISAGLNHTMAIDKNGRAWGWGNNGNGQLGDNSITQRNTPVSVLGTVKTFCQISAGGDHTMAIDKNGRAWGWGINTSGRIGDNTQISRRTPVSVAGATKTFCQISAGFQHTMAIDKNGRAWGWGQQSDGQIGDNSTTQRLTPVSVLGVVKTFCKISAGIDNYTMAIDQYGQAWGWGRQANGQIGNNSLGQFRTPVSVVGATKTFCHICAGGTSGGSNQAHTTAIDKNGRAWCWGFNNAGQLGNNSTTSQRTPVSVLGTVKTFCQIGAGGTHTVAIDKNGRAWAWGNNSNGQLGDNSTTQRLTPVSVAGATKTFCHISIRDNHNIAIDKNGRTWGWGFNTRGQLGIGFTTITPVLITYL
jgi:alpha-tubulin suppressor-like RCC1 family protein